MAELGLRISLASGQPDYLRIVSGGLGRSGNARPRLCQGGLLNCIINVGRLTCMQKRSINFEDLHSYPYRIGKNRLFMFFFPAVPVRSTWTLTNYYYIINYGKPLNQIAIYIYIYMVIALC